MSLDSDQTINPWDLAEGRTGAEQGPSSVPEESDAPHVWRRRRRDTELLDNLITEAILRT